MKTGEKNVGAALVISLAFIVMLTVVVVGMMESMRTDRPAAGQYLERSRAVQYAQSGVEQVIGTLQQLTADTNRNWISQPGQIVAGAATDDPTTTVDERKVLKFSVPLSSGSSGALPPGGAASNPFYTSPNLNVPTLRDSTTYLISETAAKMPVDWIYVTQDGTLSRTLQPDVAASPTAYAWQPNANYSPNPATNPVVGRYAYWADDESSKINYNIAWGRDAQSVAAKTPTGSPSKIDLTALAGMTFTLADAMRSFITNNNSTTLPYAFFNTPEDARKLDAQSATAGISKVLQNNKFEVTQYSHDPNTTFFNEPRIVLTTHPNLAGWTKNSSGTWVGTNGLPWVNGAASSQTGQPRYLRILNDPEDTTDPGLPYTSSINQARLYDTIQMLALRPASTGVTAGYLQRTDWPMVNGAGSFQSKYYSAYPTSSSASGISARTSRLAEMAVNIIEYVRAKESTQPIITPIIGTFDATATNPANAFVYSPNGAATNGYTGVTRVPCVTEFGVWYGQNTGADFTPTSYTTCTPALNACKPIPHGDMYFIFQIELFLPPNYGLNSYDLSKINIGIQGVTTKNPLGGYAWDPNYSSYNSDLHQIYASEVNTGSTMINAGQYVVISRAVHSTLKPTDPRPTTTSAPGATTGIKFLLEKTNGAFNNNLQIAPANNGLLGGIAISADPTVLPGGIISYETDDPRLNAHPGDWVRSSSTNTFGAKNSRWSAGKSPVTHVLPDVDTDSGGLVSDASLYMPPPAGMTFTRADGSVDDNSATGSNGQVASVAELGYIHTGVEPCSFYTDASGNMTAIPVGTGWRTIRLQPNTYPDATVVPDWALMDLFTAPVKAPTAYNTYVYAPHTTSYGGRVNLNSSAQPFSMARTTPLAAVLQGCTYDSTDLTKTVAANSGAGTPDAQTLANNIYNRTLAANGKFYGYQNGYCSPGEIAEIKGIADGGEKSEELVRQIANLVTNRGNVFSVYTIGQAIKQAPNGTCTVTAEQRVQSMVERYYNYNTTDPTKNEVRFAPVYYRNLTP